MYLYNEDNTLLLREDYGKILTELYYQDIVDPLLNEVKITLSIPSDNTDTDDYIRRNIIRTIVEIEENAIYDKIAPIEHYEYTSGTGTDTIFTEYRIHTLLAAEQIFQNENIPLYETNNDIKVNNYSIILLNGNIFPNGRNNIYLHYIAGYQVLPEALASLIIDIVVERYLQSYIRNTNGGVSGDGRIGVRTKAIAEAGTSYSTTYENIRERYATILKQFKNWSR